MKVFINYKQKVDPDHAFARLLEEHLKLKGYQVSRDESGIQAGDPWPQWIQEHVEACDIMLSLISNASLNSKWVLNEIDHALKHGKRVIPILVKKMEELDDSLLFRAYRIRFMDIQYYELTGNYDVDCRRIVGMIEARAGKAPV